MSSGVDRERIRTLREREDARFLADRPRSRRLLERARASMPNGVPVSWMATLYDHPAVFVSAGDGAYITDVDGHRYLDMNIADTSTFCGYAPQPVVEAVAERMARGAQFLLPSEDSLAVAEELGRRFGLPRWQFTLSATGANTEAVRIARAATRREAILAFDGKYLGHADELLTALDGDAVVPEYLGLTAGSAANTRMIQFNDLSALERALADREIACVVTEPAQTDLGVIMPEPGFHDALRELTRAAGTLLVIDETHTLICGPGGLTREWELEPDLVTMGKSIGGGVAIGAYGMTDGIAAVLEARDSDEPEDGHGGPLPEVAVGGTLHANALSMAATRATLKRVLTVDAYGRAVALGRRLADGIAAAISAAGLAWSAQRLYTRSGYTFAPHAPRNAIEARAAMDYELTALIRVAMANRGVWEAGDWAGPAVSIAATESDVDLYLDALRTVIGELA